MLPMTPGTAMIGGRNSKT